jgi:hypothetical protein
MFYNSHRNVFNTASVETHLLFLEDCETVVESFTCLNSMSPSKVQANILVCEASPVPAVSNEFKLNSVSSVTWANRSFESLASTKLKIAYKSSFFILFFEYAVLFFSGDERL